jgi:excisionase family DNA binding protein
MAVHTRDSAVGSARGLTVSGGPPNGGELHELLTVDDVAALLKVSRSWVYEHTRSRCTERGRLPYLKIGKYKRFDAQSVREFLLRQSKGT